MFPNLLPGIGTLPPPMTRIELLRMVVGRARANGFELRRWYVTRLGLPWINTDAALTALDAQRRYYSLLFNHEFARSFWKPGEDITFTIAARSFERIMPDGSVGQVNRKPYIRRSARRDAWRYHLQQMALAEEPLRYIRKYMHVADDGEDEVLPELPLLEVFPPEQELTASAPASTPTTAQEPAAISALEPPAPRPRRASRSAVRTKERMPPHKATALHVAPAARSGRSKPLARPVPTDLPPFLQRPPQAR